MASKARIQILDHSNERASTSFSLADVVAGGGNWDAVSGAVTDLVDAIQAFIVGNVSSYSLAVLDEQTGASAPTNEFAQRELRVSFTYADDVTGNQYNFTVATPDLTKIALPGTDSINMAAPEIAAFKTLFDSVVLSPVGNPATLISGRTVGRRA